MSDPHVEKNPVSAAAAAVGDYTDRARRWSAAHVPGGQKTVWFLLGLLLLILVVWAIRPATNSQANISRFGNGPMPVGVGQVTSGDVNITLDALGTVTPLATVTVHPELTGQLMKIDFQEGQMVKAGDVLAEIDPRPYLAALDQAKGQLERDEATLANAKVDLARYEALNREKAVAEQVYATQVALVRTDTGTVVADQAAVKAAQVNLIYCKITSPVAGRVGIRQVDVGNLVQAGGASEIVVVTQLQPMSVLFNVPEDSVNDIMGQVGKGATLSAEAYDRAQTTKLATGTLAVVDNQIDPTTGTVKLRAMFDNSRNELFPQQFVNIRLLVSTLHNQTTVPVAAIQRGASGSYVFVINRDSTVSMRTVTLGPTDGNKVAIQSGLDPGEKVVVDGADRLRDGSTVLLPGAKPPAQTTDQTGTSGQNASGHHWNGKNGHGHHHHHQDGSQSGSGSGGGP
jgi:multidrug efflux system membrane fusion protein